MSLAELLARNAAVVLGGMVALWLVSLRLRDASIVDIAWGAGFAVTAAASAWWGSAPERWWVALLVAVWGARLSGYIAWRNHGKGEDSRYAAMRAHHGARFGGVSLVTVFLFQGLLILLIALPIEAAAVSAGGGSRSVAAAGLALFALGLACETVADVQLARFKARADSAGQVMDRGLWRYSRHPNYFGDACVWWGLYLCCAGTTGVWWTAASPAAMTFLLLRVSGVALLERTIVERRPAYRDYIARTSAFIPWPPSRDHGPV